MAGPGGLGASTGGGVGSGGASRVGDDDGGVSGGTTAEGLGDGRTTAEGLGGGRAASIGDDTSGGASGGTAGEGPGPGEGSVDAAATSGLDENAVPDGLGVTARGVERTGYGIQVDNPALTVQWEGSRSATTGKGGFTDGARARLEAGGIEVSGTINGVPAGSIGPSSGLPASRVNTHNGDLASVQIADRFTGANQRVTLEAKYDAALRPVPPEVRTHNLPGDRNVDVRVDITHPSDPRLNERIEIESKAGRVDAGRLVDAQVDHDVARLSRNRALRGAGETLERVGRVARPVGIVLDAAEVYGAFRADGNTVGVNTARAATGLAGGGAGGWGGATLGAAIGTAVLPGAGTVVGAVVGGAVGAIVGSELARGTFDTVRGWFS